jgi:hypothetical protein
MTTINSSRAGAYALLAFNIVGTILTWTAHLQKPGTGVANAIAGGTAFTSPLILIAVGIVALGLTYSSRRRLALTGAILLALYGAGFAFGEITELFQHNVGISTDRWDIVLAGSVVGAVIGIAEAYLVVRTLVRDRRSRRQAATRPDRLAPAIPE